MTNRVRKKRRPTAQELRELNIMLEERVTERTAALQAANRELEAFTHSVSHDLRAPLRHITGFTELLRSHMANTEDAVTRRYLDTITASTVRMGEMLDQLLALSRLGREQLRAAPLDLSVLVKEVIEELKPLSADRQIDWRIGPLPVVTADRALLSIALRNLLSNAIKFTVNRAPALIGISAQHLEGDHHIIVRDNGAGFDMKYADGLFNVFQRLHAPSEFEGIGIGLASMKRIVQRHGGKVWAEAAPEKGATFHFTLPEAIEPDDPANATATASG